MPRRKEKARRAKADIRRVAHRSLANGLRIARIHRQRARMFEQRERRAA